MTGFGKATYENEKIKIAVEIKSVNSKSIDVQVKLPQFFKEKDIEIRHLLSTLLQRGKVDCTIDFEDKDLPVKNVINQSIVNEYYKQFKSISGNLNHNFDNIQIFEIIMRMPDVMKTAEKQIDDTEWQAIKQTFLKAIEEIDKFRIQEGKALEIDLLERINLIEMKLAQVEPYERERINFIKTKTLSALEELKGVEVDKNRFEQELIYYLEKFDITEEKIRLANHCRYFIDTVKKETAPGKKLVFITQEIGREINTLGSKANNYQIQKIVVEMKDELEKIKEQMMNII